jgi:hypothetical protein
MSWVAIAIGGSAVLGTGVQLMGVGSAKSAAAAQLSALDMANQLQKQYQDYVKNSYTSYQTAGPSALNILQTRVFSPTERKAALTSQRTALTSEIERLSTPTTYETVPILTGPKASERRQSLYTEQEANRVRDLKAAQAKLTAFDAEQAALAGVYGELDAQAQQREAAKQVYLDRISAQANLPTTLAGIRAELPNDPVFQFRQEEGERAINRAAAKRGQYFSGAAIKSLADFSLQLTGEETDKYLARQQLALQSSIAGLQATTASQQADVGNILSIANLGLDATKAATGQAVGLAQTQATTAAAAAQPLGAAATAGQTALRGIAGDVSSAATLFALSKAFAKPTTTTDTDGASYTSAPTGWSLANPNPGSSGNY